MQVSVSDAKAQLTELVRRAETGEEIVLTRHGRSAVRLVPVAARVGRDARARLLESVRAAAAGKAAPGAGAAQSHDFLYGEDGLPG
jgi:prevent-host-death family protein